jgi:hypothetical protein
MFGICISEKDTAKIFNRFYSVEGLSTKYSGLGIVACISPAKSSKGTTEEYGSGAKRVKNPPFIFRCQSNLDSCSKNSNPL